MKVTSFPFRSTRLTCVSHSLVTLKRSLVTARSRWATARVEKVPPDWEMRSTTELRKE